jgi:DNA-binding beta-propeller fold protein YncE
MGLLLLPALVLGFGSVAGAESDLDSLRQVRIVEADESGPEGAPGIPFPPMSGLRLLPDIPYAGMATVLIPDGSDDVASMIPIELPDPINFALTGGEEGSYRLFMLDQTTGDLIEVQVQRAWGKAKLRAFGIGGLRLVEPSGMAFDHATGDLFILDAGRGTLVRVHGDLFYEATEVSLPPALAASTDLRGLAFDPRTQHFYILSPSAGELYEVDEVGSFRSLRSMTELGAFRALGMTFASSWDATDPPERTHLYLATSSLGSGAPLITEWSFTPRSTDLPQAIQPAALRQASALRQSSAVATTSSVVTPVSNLNQTIDTSSFIPPSPDSAGIAYQPSTDSMLLVDSEVNEMPIYQGVNVFEHDRFATLLDTFDSTGFSDEPTGVAVDPSTGTCFFSDDTGTRTVYVVNPGPDQTCLTADDAVSSFRTKIFGSNDPEGLTFCQGSLFVIDGVNEEWYEIQPGLNGIFDGAPPDGDDVVTSCDTSFMGVVDPEGITCDDATEQIYIVGRPATMVAQATRSCEIVTQIDISAANADKPAGLGFAPSSVVPSEYSLWITDRVRDVDPADHTREHGARGRRGTEPEHDDAQPGPPAGIHHGRRDPRLDDRAVEPGERSGRRQLLPALGAADGRELLAGRPLHPPADRQRWGAAVDR